MTTSGLLAPRDALTTSGNDGSTDRKILTDSTGAQKVSGSSAVVTVAVPGLSTSPAYAAGDCVGTLMTFPDVIRAAGLGAILQHVGVMSKAARTESLDLVLFHANPAATTFTDNAALAVNAADFNKLAGVVHLYDWSTLGTPSYGQAMALALPFRLTTGTSLYAVLVARAALTLVSTSDLSVALKTLQD